MMAPPKAADNFTNLAYVADDDGQNGVVTQFQRCILSLPETSCLRLATSVAAALVPFTCTTKSLQKLFSAAPPIRLTSALLVFDAWFKSGNVKLASAVNDPVVVASNPSASSLSTLSQSFSETQEYSWSRFTFFRITDGLLRLESAALPGTIEIKATPEGSLNLAGNDKFTADSFHECCGLSNADDSLALFFFALHFGFVMPCSPSGVTSEETSSKHVQWEFHDLLMYTRSRLGRYGHKLGAT